MRSIVATAAFAAATVSSEFVAAGEAASESQASHVAAAPLLPSAGELGGTVLVVLLGMAIVVWLTGLVLEQLGGTDA
jgi:hypothetical protein